MSKTLFIPEHCVSSFFRDRVLETSALFLPFPSLRGHSLPFREAWGNKELNLSVCLCHDFGWLAHLLSATLFFQVAAWTDTLYEDHSSVFQLTVLCLTVFSFTTVNFSFHLLGVGCPSFLAELCFCFGLNNHHRRDINDHGATAKQG